MSRFHQFLYFIHNLPSYMFVVHQFFDIGFSLQLFIQCLHGCNGPRVADFPPFVSLVRINLVQLAQFVNHCLVQGKAILFRNILLLPNIFFLLLFLLLLFLLTTIDLGLFPGFTVFSFLILPEPEG